MPIHWLYALWRMPFAFKAFLAMGAYGWGRQYWQQRQQKSLLAMAKYWPTYAGRVVAVQAVRTKKDDRDSGGWEGLLTYSYLIDEIEVGEFRQPFSAEDEVDEWVRSLRDKSVTIAVDPNDPRRSIWVADQAIAAKANAIKQSDEAEPEALTTNTDLFRLIVFWISVIGAFLASWSELTGLVLSYRAKAAPTNDFTGVVGGCAVACFFAAAYIFKKRFPGRTMGSVARQWNDPAIKLALKVFGALESATILWLWLRWSEGNMMSAIATHVIFKAAWVGLYVTAAITLWVCGPHSKREHELAPRSGI